MFASKGDSGPPCGEPSSVLQITPFSIAPLFKYFLSNAKLLGIPELNTYLGGSTNDILAVKNAISYAYNNGLAEGSVNKIKLAKRIMYGRNSFALLRAKLLLNEHFN